MQDCSNSIANALELLQSCTLSSQLYRILSYDGMRNQPVVTDIYNFHRAHADSPRLYNISHEIGTRICRAFSLCSLFCSIVWFSYQDCQHFAEKKCRHFTDDVFKLFFHKIVIFQLLFHWCLFFSFPLTICILPHIWVDQSRSAWRIYW